jgi:hypothetical protein
MRFLGRKWQKKNDGKNKTNKISQLHLRSFDRGRAVPCSPAVPLVSERRFCVWFGEQRDLRPKGTLNGDRSGLQPSLAGLGIVPRGDALAGMRRADGGAVLAVETKSPAGAGPFAGTEAD